MKLIETMRGMFAELGRIPFFRLKEKNSHLFETEVNQIVDKVFRVHADGSNIIDPLRNASIVAVSIMRHDKQEISRSDVDNILIQKVDPLAKSKKGERRRFWPITDIHTIEYQGAYYFW